MKYFILFTLVLTAGILFESCTKNETEKKELDGWSIMGKEGEMYTIGKDTAKYSGQPVYFLKSTTAGPELMGTAANNLIFDKYRGKRIRMTGYLKTEITDSYAEMFLRIDGGTGFSGNTISYDDMQNRPIVGTTDWQKYEIVLDVSEQATSVLYGVHVYGKGQAWFSGMSFEIVGNDVPVTDQMKK